MPAGGVEATAAAAAEAEKAEEAAAVAVVRSLRCELAARDSAIADLQQRLSEMDRSGPPLPTPTLLLPPPFPQPVFPHV